MAGLAILLASDAGSYITGTSIINDGGLMNTPFLMDFQYSKKSLNLQKKLNSFMDKHVYQVKVNT